MAIFVDVSPHDLGWVALVSRLSRYPFFQVLVTIREEDYRRANLAESFDYAPIDLNFEEGEARLIYERAQGAHLVHDTLTFEDAWHSFGGNGPLMEFVYFLTQTETLYERLKGQVNRLRNEVRMMKLSSDELHLLRLVAVATAYDAHIPISSLLQIVNLPEPKLTFDYFEKEYLLRVSHDQTSITGLHPVRSKLLSDLLTDPDVYPWENVVNEILPITQEEDWEIFIFQAFIDYPEKYDEIINIAKSLKPCTWKGINGVIKCLLWVGIRLYIEENWGQVEAARELFGQGWNFITDLNFAGVEAPSIEGWWKNLGNLISEDKQKEIERIRQSQSPKENIFKFALEWMKSLDDQIEIPISEKDWGAASETLYWAYRWGLSEKIGKWVSDENILSVVPSLPLETVSELFLGIYYINQDRYFSLIEETRSIIEKRIADELDIFALEIKEGAMFIHFLTYPEETTQYGKSREIEGKSIHDKTMRRLQLIRQLFPNFEKYGSHGYGHQISFLGLDHDDSFKAGIEKNYLIPKWPIQTNGMATGLIQYSFRPDRWEDYFLQIIDIRQQIHFCLSSLIPGVSRYFGREKSQNLLELNIFSSGQWDKIYKSLLNIPLLPKTAVDPWGVAQPEGKSPPLESMVNETKNLQRLLPTSIIEQIYRPYLDASQKYFSSIRNFMDQAVKIILINFRTGKLLENSSAKQSILLQLGYEANLNIDYLSYFNLSEGKKALPNYQSNFHRLFGHRIEPNLINRVENQESETINVLWPMWYFFALRPRTSLSTAQKQIPIRVKVFLDSFISKVNKSVESLKELNDRIVLIGQKWEDHSAIFIHIDVERASQIYPKIEELINSLKAAIGIIDPKDILYELIEDQCQFIVIAVTVQGKMINNLVWPLRTVFTIINQDSIEDSLWAYIPHELSQKEMIAMELNLWDDDEIAKASQFSLAVSALRVLISLLTPLKDIPELSSAGKEMLDNFMEKRSIELSALLQSFIDSGKLLLERHNNLTEDELLERSYLSEATSSFIQIYTEILPEGSDQGQVNLDVNELMDFVKKLENAIPVCETIKLLWIDDIIKYR